MNYQSLRLYLLLSTVLLLQACAAVLVTGGAAGVTATAVDKRTTGTMIEDQAIEFKVSAEYRKHEDIKEQAHWNVTSFNTRVLLTGEAPSEDIQQRMGTLAQDVEKVSHVYNEISIAAPSSMMSRSSDTVITGKVKTLLLADKNTKGLNIKVHTSKGVVYLMGLVSQQQGDSATEVTRKTGGVQKVVKLFEYID